MSNNKPLVRVEQVMQTDFALVDGLKTVAEGIDTVKTQGVHVLIVNKRHDDDEYGLVQFSDIAKKVLAKDKSPERVNLYEIMMKPVLAVKPSMDIRYCARLLERFDLHLVPVIADEKVLGFVDYNSLVMGAYEAQK